MSKVAKAVAVVAIGVGIAVATGGAGLGAIGSFLTTNTFGKLLSTVALSALSSAITRVKPRALSPSADGPTAGIRTSQTQTGGTNPASFVLGEYATEGTLVAPPMSTGSDGNVVHAYLNYVVDLGDIPGHSLQGLIIDGAQVTFTGNVHQEFGQEIGGRFENHAWIRYYDGSQTEADPMLAARYASYAYRPWTSDMVGRGICYAVLTFLYNREVFNGFPTVRFIMGGIPLYDPRKDDTVGGIGAHRYGDRSTWESSSNTAVQIYNILRGIDFGGGYVWGGGADASDLPLANWWAQMNIADTAEALSGGGSEPRFRTGYEVLAEDTPADVIDQLLAATSGEIAENGGVWKLRLGGPALPVYFFSDDDVVVSEPEDYSPFSAERQPYNGVQAVYPDPEALWEPRDAPARYNAQHALADPAQRRIGDLTLSAAPFPNQVQRVMRAYVEEELREVRHELTLPFDALVLEQLDVVSWTSGSRGYTSKAFEIDAMIDPLVAGTPRVTLKERDPDDAAWQTGYELPTEAPSTGDVLLPAQEVEGFAAAAFAIEDENGTPARPALRLSWTPVAEDIRGIEFEIEASNGSTIVKITSLNVSAGEYIVSEGIMAAKSYRARARFVVDRPSVWTAFIAVDAPDLRLRPDDVDRLAFQADGLALFGGALQSTDYVSEVSGWQIQQSGDAEFNNLITRGWIQEGAVSEGGSFAAHASPVTYLDEEAALEFHVGPTDASELWQIAASWELRRRGLEYEDDGQGGANVFNVRTRVSLQIDVQSSGVWSGYSTQYSSLFEQNSLFRRYAFIVPVIGTYTDVRIRSVFELTNTLTSTQTFLQPNEYQTNVRNVFYIAKAVVR